MIFVITFKHIRFPLILGILLSLFKKGVYWFHQVPQEVCGTKMLKNLC